MSQKKMLINTDLPEECRAVMIENGKLEDYIVEHSSQELIKGNVYLGIISRIEPAIEAAFVDYGGKKYGFLPFKDVRKESYIHTGERKAKTRIQDVLFPGQALMVQVIKEERDAKGPTLSNSISIPGRYLVLMFGNDSAGISRKIEDDEERKKLKKILSSLVIPEGMGVIIRTAGLGRTKAELQKDVQMLNKIWENIQQEIKEKGEKNPLLLYQGPTMLVRTVRDHFTNDTDEILVDSPDAYKKIKEFFKMVMPRMANRVKQYKESRPLFSIDNIEKQIEQIFNRRVELPSGGSLVIDRGEALTAIDVNSGKTTSASELEETAYRTNMEAADEIAKQLRLRDLGGLIVIDFIDMFSKKNKSNVEKQFRLACKKDKARVNIARISKFGLLEMSRQRMSPPIADGTLKPCPHCDGHGKVKSVVSTGVAVLRRIHEILGAGTVTSLEVGISSELADYLLNQKRNFLSEMEEKHKVRVVFKSHDGLPFDQFTYNVLETRKAPDKEKRERPVREDNRGRKEGGRNRRDMRPRDKDKVEETKVAEPPEVVETESVQEEAMVDGNQKKPDTGASTTTGRRPKSTPRKRVSRKTAGNRSSGSRSRRGRPGRPSTRSAEAKTGEASESSSTVKPSDGDDSSLKESLSDQSGNGEMPASTKGTGSSSDTNSNATETGKPQDIQPPIEENISRSISQPENPGAETSNEL